MRQIYLHDFSYALGEQRLSVEASVRAGRTLSSTETLQRAGFYWHHVCGAETTAYDLARRTLEPLRDRLHGTSAILYVTCLPQNGNLGARQAFAASRDVKHLMDFPVSHLQAQFELGTAIAVGINQQACTGMLGSLRIARSLLMTEPDFDRVLCITADRFPPEAYYEQAYNLISDGAAACLVSRQPHGFRLVSCHQISNGALVQASDDESVGVYFNYTQRLIREALGRAHLTINDIDWIVPQNMNLKAWQILARLLGFDCQRVSCESLAQVAHVISGDTIINLSELDSSGKLSAGDRLLLVMAGYGMNWQAVIVEKV